MARLDSAIKVEDSVKILTYIIGSVGFLSVVRHVNPFYSIVFALLCFFSLYFEYRRSFLIPRWLLNTVSLSVIIPGFIRIRADDFVTPSLETLLMLLAIKFLENKRFRDFMQICIISVFLLAGSSLLSLDIVFLVYFVSLMFLLAVTTVLLAYYSQDSALELKRATVLKIVLNSLFISLISIPVTLFMFIILPRTSYPMLDFLNRGSAASTGFSDSVRLGRVSDIQEDATVILRVNMEKVDDRFLYWRGIVLDHFDGVSWRHLRKNETDLRLRSDIPGRRIWQVLYLEPYGNNYLFALDRPVTVPLPRVQKYSDLTFSQPEYITRRTRYQALSALTDMLPERDIERKRYLQLPAGNLEKTRDLAERLSSGKNEQEKIKALFGFLRNGDYKYSLKKLSLSSNPLEDFLFRKKYGNCEYFASAMAVMLRATGVPARLVGGYRGGYYNDVGKYYLITQRNAHVWVEVYLDCRGWLRIDPTPAAMESLTDPDRDGVVMKIRFLLDTFNYYWNASVINYNLEGQIQLFQKLGASIRKPHFNVRANERELAGYFLLLLTAASCLSILYIIIRGKKTPEEEIMSAFSKKMGRLGHPRTRSEGLEEFAAKIDDGERKERVYEFVREFERHYYRDSRLSKKDIQKLRELIRAI
ncbi:MAG: DUF3488 and transglutaminase-like domain-containing protein [Nitrospirae bacterium]|nr:DUF3488 and transglutaminase-like domain-containing protein [Nitrospirota bacterium]MCL5237642.1 DUF3488 and transglutaminase-like domain-containing protein [Nitrospirota bacterium]